VRKLQEVDHRIGCDDRHGPSPRRGRRAVDPRCEGLQRDHLEVVPRHELDLNVSPFAGGVHFPLGGEVGAGFDDGGGGRFEGVNLSEGREGQHEADGDERGEHFEGSAADEYVEFDAWMY